MKINKVSLVRVLAIGIAINAIFLIVASRYGNPYQMGSGDFFGKLGLIELFPLSSNWGLIYVVELAFLYYATIYCMIPVIFVLPAVLARILRRKEISFWGWLGGVLFIYIFPAIIFGTMAWKVSQQI